MYISRSQAEAPQSRACDACTCFLSLGVPCSLCVARIVLRDASKLAKWSRIATCSDMLRPPLLQQGLVCLPGDSSKKRAFVSSPLLRFSASPHKGLPPETTTLKLCSALQQALKLASSISQLRRAHAAASQEAVNTPFKQYNAYSLRRRP